MPDLWNETDQKQVHIVRLFIPSTSFLDRYSVWHGIIALHETIFAKLGTEDRGSSLSSSSTSLQMFHLSSNFNFENSKQLQGDKFGEYGG